MDPWPSTASQEVVVEPSTTLFSEPLISIIRQAIAERATDVHLDPIDTGKMVRFRVDGMVHEKPRVPWNDRLRVMNQIKVAANFDIDRSFVPQEGLIAVRDPEFGQHDIRVSIMPCGTRESVHFRFLSASRQITNIENLGLCEADVGRVRQQLTAPHGLILVTGGTGSGKTTTLYAMANSLDKKNTVTVSIEDPVEFNLAQIRQVQVDEYHGLTMSEGLRVLLRMDPDAILVGEIRDPQSAVTAARAALTGRLVLATLHSPNPAVAIDALHHLGVPRYVLAEATRLVVNQDVIRRLCNECAEAVPVTDEQKAVFERYDIEPPETTRKAVGCEACSDYGYYGRTGVFEVTRIDRELGREISAGAGQDSLLVKMRNKGSRPLLADALEKVANGVTSFEEVMTLIEPAEMLEE